MLIKSINPYDNSLIKEYKNHTNDEVQNIIDDSNSEFLLWKTHSFDYRKDIILKIAEKLKLDADSHAKMITLEMGKPISESKAEILKCIWVLEYYAHNASEFLKPESIESDYSKSYIQYDPIGIVFGIMPWNFPYWQVFRFIAPSIMAGNTCILKHASNVSGCALLIEKLIHKVTKHKNIFNTLVISSSQVEAIIKNKHVMAVTLTGSEFAGSEVAMKAGKEIKKTVLELGGSDCFIVLDDANINKAAKTAITARFLNTGQSCIAAKRFLVHKDIYEDFITKIEKYIKKLVIGDPLNQSTNIGPLAKEKFAEELDVLVQASIAKGAKCLLGGNKNKAFYEPTLLIDVTESMDVFKCETFGPVFCISKISNVEEAINIANNSEYGLGGSIWTNNIDLGKNMATQIETGAVFINDMTKSDPRLPFGGVKKSGYGIELSKYGIREFVNMKTIAINE